MAIRVETREVVVPVVVTDKSYVHDQKTPGQRGAYLNRTYGKPITGLSAKDFQIFEDGKEQRIQSVSVKRLSFWGVRDNVSSHIDNSCSPTGIWSSPDLWPQTHVSYSDQPVYVYLVSYEPPPSSEGACHKIQVKVSSKKASVSAREEYCNVKYPPSDRLSGTRLEEQMEEFADSSQEGKFPLSTQVAPFFQDADANRVAVAVEFPGSALKREWNNGNLKASIALLGLVYDKDKRLVARFSDTACHTSSYWIPARPDPMPPTLAKDFNYIAIPERYETQIGLPPGNYDLKLVVTDGEKFGRAEAPVRVETYEPQRLGMSAVVLCKRYHKVPDPSEEEARPTGYVPLVTNGLAFTPAGDTRFGKGDRFLAYLELSQPLDQRTATAKLQLQMRVINANTGQTLSDSMLAVESATSTGNSVVPVANEIAIDKLSAGPYRLEVQASDSAGNKTPWREASFTIVESDARGQT